jgi:hypothetical protein
MDANFQSTVHIQDSLVVNGNSDMNGTLDVSGNTDIDGTLDVDGTSNLDSTYVTEVFNFNGDLFNVNAFQSLVSAEVIGNISSVSADLSNSAQINGIFSEFGMPSPAPTGEMGGDPMTPDTSFWSGFFGDTDGPADFNVDSVLFDLYNSGAPFAGTFAAADYYMPVSPAPGTSDPISSFGSNAWGATADSMFFYADNIDINANTDMDGTLDVEEATNLQSTLTVAGFADLNDSLDVAMSVNIQDNLDVNDSLSLNSAANEGRILTVYDSQGGLGVTIESTNTSGSTSATTLTTHRLIVQDDAVYNGDMSVNGALAVTNNITSAAAPSSPNHITNKQYVDDAIAAAITPPQMWDYEAVNSTSGDTIYYINGDLLLYGTEEEALINYTIKVYGEDLNETGTDMEIVQARLRSRGNAQPLTGAGYDWTPNTDGGTATFNIGYTDIMNLSGGQEDGYVSCSLQFETAGGQQYNSGLTIRFYLDSSNPAATSSDFETTTVED